MKILAINFSLTPKEASFINLLMNALADGMREEEADVEIVKIDNKNNKILPCDGCLNCWTVTPGRCSSIKDYMTTELFEKWKNCDIVVYGTPIYNKFMTASMKSFLERLHPSGALENFRGDNDLKKENIIKYPDTIMLATATYHGKDEFTYLSQYMNEYYAIEKNSKILAELYRPQVKLLANKYFKNYRNKTLVAFKNAGKELIKNKKVSNETMEKINYNVTDLEKYNKLISLVNKTLKEEKVSLQVFLKNKISLNISTIEEFTLLSNIIFENIDFSENLLLEAFKIQFKFVEGDSLIKINNNNIVAIKHFDSESNVIIQTTIEVWMSIFNGKSNFANELNIGKLNIEFRNDISKKYFLRLMAFLIQN